MQQFLPNFVDLLDSEELTFVGGGTGSSGSSGYTSWYASSVNLVPQYEALHIGLIYMLDVLPINNEIAIQVKGYRNGVTKEMYSGASFTVQIYDDEGTLISIGSADSLGGPDTVNAGNYGGSITGVGLVAGQKYRVVITEGSNTVWTKWFVAQVRPTLW